jgi:hypothetical protein
MTVLSEILEWSRDRPLWQRDALRRLVQQGDLSDADIAELTRILKAAHGLDEQQATSPLAKEHLPNKATGSPVSLVSILHRRGVNALAENQTLKFTPALSVVYGDNAAGKTGYIRILKSACRARGQEEILGNVVSGTAPPSLGVSIKYRIGLDPEPCEWAGEGDDEFIARVSVFDTRCAAVYLTEKTDIAFRPLGLDLFDKLVKACKAVRGLLEAEQRAMSIDRLSSVRGEIPEGTSAAKLLVSLSSLTKPEQVRALSRMSREEEERLVLLEKSLLDLQANDPHKLTRELALRSGRVKALAAHLKTVEAALQDQVVAAVFTTRTQGRLKSQEAKRLREATLSAGRLPGTGSEQWTALWEAARQFSEELAYPDQPFPMIGDEALCVLCQQGIDDTTAQRLGQFESFVASVTERELREARESFARQRRTVTDLNTMPEAVQGYVEELRIEHDGLATAVLAAIATNETRREAVSRALTEDQELAADCPALATIANQVEAVAHEIDARIATLQTSPTDEARKQIGIEAQELRARKLLQAHEGEVLDDIERRQRYAAYALCIDETKTQAITQKSTAVTKAAVSERLGRQFKDELKALEFRHIEVDLREVGGAEGVLYHKLVLTRAPGVELTRVVSEGEQRCLSIAAFFAELCTADDQSGIVFDDPVSSLDYMWRDAVARRLVQEAKKRQVIVFTHDVVFLLRLKELARELGVDQSDQHVRTMLNGAGVCTDELPWVALPVKRRIGFLKSGWQDADKLHRDGNVVAYEKEAAFLYGLLREAWERALEEVLLGGVVERYRPGVQTQQIASIADITPEDCQVIEAAMTKTSRWLPGHDEAPAARAPVPGPDELKGDIDALANWVGAINSRRNRAHGSGAVSAAPSRGT